MRKISDTSDIKQGDVLYDPETSALFEVYKVDFGMALLEIMTKSPQICATPHEESEEWFTAPGDAYWVFLSQEFAEEWFQTDTEIRAWALYLDELYVVEPPADLPKIETASLIGRRLELALSSSETISTIIPKLELPKPEDLRKIRERGTDELLESVISKIVEYNTVGKNSLKLDYAELLTLKSKLEESGYRVDFENSEISW